MCTWNHKVKHARTWLSTHPVIHFIEEIKKKVEIESGNNLSMI